MESTGKRWEEGEDQEYAQGKGLQELSHPLSIFMKVFSKAWGNLNCRTECEPRYYDKCDSPAETTSICCDLDAGQLVSPAEYLR